MGQIIILSAYSLDTYIHLSHNLILAVRFTDLVNVLINTSKLGLTKEIGIVTESCLYK